MVLEPARLAAFLIITCVLLLGTAAAIRLLAPAATGPGAAQVAAGSSAATEDLIAGCIRIAREAASGH